MKGRPLIIGLLAVVAVIAAVSIYVSVVIDKTEQAISAVVSLDGKYKAVKITMTRGGSRPFCFNSVSVIFAIYPDYFAERYKAYEVYAAPCGKFANGEPAPTIEWRSATDLQIGYAANPAALTAGKTAMKLVDVTKTVHVTFVPRD